MKKGVEMWVDFDREISLQETSATPSPALLESAALVYQNVALAYWWWAIGWIIWTGVASLFAIMVIFIALA